MGKDILSEYHDTIRGCKGHNNYIKSSLTSLDKRANKFKELLDGSNFKDLLEQLESMKMFAVNFKETKLSRISLKIDQVEKQQEINPSFVEKANSNSNQKNKIQVR